MIAFQVVRTAEDLARWDESKKWQKKIENIKAKLFTAEEEVAKLSKANQGLKDVITRLEREKLMLDGKVKSATREAQVCVQHFISRKMFIVNYNAINQSRAH